MPNRTATAQRQSGGVQRVPRCFATTGGTFVGRKRDKAVRQLAAELIVVRTRIGQERAEITARLADVETRFDLATETWSRHSSKAPPDPTQFDPREFDRAVATADEAVQTAKAAYAAALCEMTAGLPPLATAAWDDVDLVELSQPHATARNRVPPDGVRLGVLTDTAGGPVAAVPLIGWANLQVDGPRDRALELVITALARAVLTTPAGQLAVAVCDPITDGRQFAAFGGLAATGVDVATCTDARTLQDTVKALLEHANRIHLTVLRGRQASLADLKTADPTNHEPYRVLVITDLPEKFGAEQLSTLFRLCALGPSAGISVIIRKVDRFEAGDIAHSCTAHVDRGVLDVPRPEGDPRRAEAPCKVWGRVDFDAVPDTDYIVNLVEALATRMTSPAVTQATLLGLPRWAKSSQLEISAPVGERTGELVDIAFNDHNPHALLCGPSGSGKSVLLRNLISSLAWQYPPEELEMVLLDYKHGVEFNIYAPSRRREQWLPHASIIGVRSDREFGLAVLDHLCTTMTTRAAAERDAEANNLAALRKAEPDGRWPRILVVIDEFQELLKGNDQVAKNCVARLIDLAKQGRSHGIHLLLSTQNLSGMTSLIGVKDALFGQCTLRIAMPHARDVLAMANTRADELPKWHALINTASGSPGDDANIDVRVAPGDEDAERYAIGTLWKAHSRTAAPRVFDGSQLADPVAALRAMPHTPHGVSALIGEPVAVATQPLVFPLDRTPNRHLAVVGTRQEPRNALILAALSTMRQRPPGGITYDILALSDASAAAADTVANAARSHGHTARLHTKDTAFDALGTALTQADPNRLSMLIVFEGEELRDVLDQGGSDGRKREKVFQVLLRDGPKAGVHLLGWWQTASSLKEVLGMTGRELIGGVYAFNIAGSELSWTIPNFSNWQPREYRAAFLDRANSTAPVITVPYRIPEELL